jgi:hypothetical protein
VNAGLLTVFGGVLTCCGQIISTKDRESVKTMLVIDLLLLSQVNKKAVIDFSSEN